MLIRRIFRALRASWLLSGALVLLAVSFALIFSLRAKPMYTSGSQVIVTANGVRDATTAYQGDLYVQQRTATYAILARGDRLSKIVVSKYGLDMSVAELANRVTASVPTGTNLLNIAVSGRSPAEAQKLTSAITEQLIPLVESYEAMPGSTTKSRVSIAMTQSPQLSPKPISPNTRLNLLIGLLLGVALAAGASVARMSSAESSHARASTDAATGEAKTRHESA